MLACAGNHHGRHLLDWGWGPPNNHRYNGHYNWGSWYYGWGGHHSHEHDHDSESTAACMLADDSSGALILGCGAIIPHHMALSSWKFTCDCIVPHRAKWRSAHEALCL